MSSIDHSAHEINLKIVYYGPGLGGKTTSLQAIHDQVSADHRGQLISLATGEDRTLYFDFFPLELPKVRGYTIKVHLYTVPGQNHYNSTRKLVLNGADGVVFVADSQRMRSDANAESMRNLEENLRDQAVGIEQMPLVIQYNKRDAPNLIPIGELEAALNPRRVLSFESVATTRQGVFEALKAITKQVIRGLAQAESARAQSASKRPESESESGSEPKPEPESAAPGPRTLGNEAFEFSATASSFSEISQVFNVSKARKDYQEAAAARTDDATADPPTAQVASPEASDAVATELDAEGTEPDLAVATPAQPRPDAVAGGVDLLALIDVAWLKEAGRHAERCVAERDYAGAVRLAANATDRLAETIERSPASAWPRAALALGVPAARFDRFEATTKRALAGDEVTHADALYAIFFLIDLNLRWQAVRGPQASVHSTAFDEPAASQLRKHS